jgi:hypothetical protein
MFIFSISEVLEKRLFFCFAVGAAGAATSEILPENQPKLRKCQPKWTFRS